MSRNPHLKQLPLHEISKAPGIRFSLLLLGTILLAGDPVEQLKAAKSNTVRIEENGSVVNKKQGKGPPAHAPAHGYRRKFCYRYYPQAEVYHDTERGLWFYTDGKSWRAGAKLPIDLGRELGGHVSIELESENPAVEHSRVRETYQPEPETGTGDRSLPSSRPSKDP